MNFTLVMLSLLLPTAFASIDTMRPWERSSNPSIMSRTFEKKFSTLPLTGQVSETKKYWSSDSGLYLRETLTFAGMLRRPSDLT